MWSESHRFFGRTCSSLRNVQIGGGRGDRDPLRVDFENKIMKGNSVSLSLGWNGAMKIAVCRGAHIGYCIQSLQQQGQLLFVLLCLEEAEIKASRVSTTSAQPATGGAGRSQSRVRASEPRILFTLPCCLVQRQILQQNEMLFIGRRHEEWAQGPSVRRKCGR